MLIITESQLGLMEDKRRSAFVEKLLPKFKKLQPEFLPGSDKEIRNYLNRRIIESKRWGLANDQQVEKYIYLCLSYKTLNEKELSKMITDLLTWPGRSGHDKLEYLHIELIKGNYVVNSQ